VVASYRSPVVQSLLSSMIGTIGLNKGEDWVLGVLSNLASPPSGNSFDNLTLINNNKGDVTIINSSEYYQLLNSSNSADQELVKDIGIVYPKNKDGQTYSRLYGAAMGGDPPHSGNAVRFLDFIANVEAQQILTNAYFERSVIPSVKMLTLKESMPAFEMATLHFDGQCVFNQKAVILLKKVGWNE